MKNVLNLVLKAKWYNMIESGVKTEEYREIKPYWEKRLLDYKALAEYVEKNRQEIIARQFLFPFSCPLGGDACEMFPKNFNEVQFHYGYSGKTMTFECLGIEFGVGKVEWGAPSKDSVFIIKLGKRIK